MQHSAPQACSNLHQTCAKTKAKASQTCTNLSQTCVEIDAKPVRTCLQPAQAYVKTVSFCIMLLLNLFKPVPHLYENPNFCSLTCSNLTQAHTKTRAKLDQTCTNLSPKCVYIEEKPVGTCLLPAQTCAKNESFCNMLLLNLLKLTPNLCENQS